jgi:vanillate O-demethylase monooxygenase subunit
MYIRNTWYVAARSSEVGRTLLQRWILDEPYVLYRTEAGRPVVMDDRCPHRRYALSRGNLKGDALECAYHGLTFAPDGVCIRVPGEKKAPRGIAARLVPTVEKHRWVWVWPGDPAKADPRLVPDFHWMDAADWDCFDDRREMACHYQLVTDNLLDLTHETFVHQATIGHDELAEVPIETRREDGRVHVDRVVRNCTPPPLFSKSYEFDGNIDRYQLIRFEPPSYVKIEVRAVETGTNDFSRGLRWEVLNAVTPATPDSCHYFWGLSRRFAQGDQEMTRMLYAGVQRTFDEDQRVLEVQHRLIRTDRPGTLMTTVHNDRGVVLARRMVDELIAGEQAETRASA